MTLSLSATWLAIALGLSLAAPAAQAQAQQAPRFKAVAFDYFVIFDANSIVPEVEKAIIDSGVILIKYWLEVSPEEQTRRLEARIDDGRKIWKLSKMDLKSYTRWDAYSKARDEMFSATDTPWAPWYVARSDDKRKARLNIIEHLLSRIPYTEIKRERVKLPKRHITAASERDTYSFKFIPEPH